MVDTKTARKGVEELPSGIRGLLTELVQLRVKILPGRSDG